MLTNWNLNENLKEEKKFAHFTETMKSKCSLYKAPSPDLPNPRLNNYKSPSTGFADNCQIIFIFLG